MKNSIILGILLIATAIQGFSQDMRKPSMIYGVGLGYTALNERVSGFGPNINIGLIYKSNFDRLRINPNLQLGSYLSGESSPTRDQYYNCVNLDLLVHLTLIRIKAFSLDLQTGGFIGNSRGLVGTGTELDIATSTNVDFSTSQFVNDFNYGFKIGGGLLYRPKKSRFSYGFYPINIPIGNNEFSGLHAKFEISMGLCKD